MARVQLTEDERRQLTDAKAELIELRTQIESGLASGVTSSALSDAVNQQISQVDNLLSNFA